jgi:AcrR family transcriptional regulator
MSTRPLRSDAVRNRARLVDAAVRAFRDHGLGASVNAIADAAGVNVATLYRHFPTKDALIGAVLESVLDPLAIARETALASDDALATFMREAVRLQGEEKGLVDALGHHPSGLEVRARLRGPAIDIVTPIVERAHRDGDLRPDFDALDLLIAFRMLSVLAEAPDRADRYVDVVLRGLRPEAD